MERQSAVRDEMDAAEVAHARPAMAPRLPGISVFFPCHNEEGNIERVVAGMSAELARIAERRQLIIVDDGSRDRTGEIADRLAADSHVLAVHHPTNRGYGGAVISGIAAASEPWILLCDGDGQFDPADLEKMTALTADYDVIVGRRVRRADHLARRLNGWAWTLLMRLLFGIRISDIDCGFKLFHRELIDAGELRARGAMISTELMARMAGRGARVVEVDVNHLPRQTGEQSGANLKVIFRAFRELGFLYRDLRRESSRDRAK